MLFIERKGEKQQHRNANESQVPGHLLHEHYDLTIWHQKISKSSTRHQAITVSLPRAAYSQVKFLTGSASPWTAVLPMSPAAIPARQSTCLSLKHEHLTQLRNPSSNSCIKEEDLLPGHRFFCSLKDKGCHMTHLHQGEPQGAQKPWGWNLRFVFRCCFSRAPLCSFNSTNTAEPWQCELGSNLNCISLFSSQDSRPRSG